ncbi:hypothetical protein E3T55_10315 [Cryobacterium frigoriphilum]|uniref:N-acetyltransferase domain-containing protein n=1 Tax=Cryobacterium frigoriphilum TaxID=1259150 RepID=A0A4R9A1K1_9MICO|nr:hypothetical protein [Cryobacterium frigoriphilum]TFD50286.1 hypothetical protein E3T55_10315 [Cryobacterium frigoriphilum]
MADTDAATVHAAEAAIFDRKKLSLEAAASAGLPGRFAWIQLDGLRASVATAHQFGFLNVVEGVTDESASALPEALDRFAAPHHATVVATSPSPDLIARLRSGGFEPAATRPIAYLRLDSASLHTAIMDRWEIRQVNTGQEAILFADILDAGYAASNDVSSLIRAEHARAEVRAFIAFGDSVPLAAAAMSAHRTGAVLGGASTLSMARGAGAQSALLMHRLRVARDIGCPLAAASAAPGSPSIRNLARLGFTVVDRTAWRLTRSS